VSGPRGLSGSAFGFPGRRWRIGGQIRVTFQRRDGMIEMADFNPQFPYGFLWA
jgi:hypothetical protein